MSGRGDIFHQAGIAALGLVLVMTSLSYARHYFESAKCARRMAVISQAVLAWAAAHEGRLPPDLRSLSNRLDTPAILVCPGDRSREPATNWGEVFSVNNSYWLSQWPSWERTNLFSLFCGVHGSFVRSDGTVVSRTPVIKSPLRFLGAAILMLVWFRFFVVHLQRRPSSSSGIDVAGLKHRVALVREQIAAEHKSQQVVWYRRHLLAAARKAVQALAYFRHTGRGT